MTDSCPNCGADLPPELGQHALTPVSGLVQCPSCGETVTLEKATGGEGEGEGQGQGVDVSGETTKFSGEETVEGVMDELEEKPGGPTGEEREL